MSIPGRWEEGLTSLGFRRSLERPFRSALALVVTIVAAIGTSASAQSSPIDSKPPAVRPGEPSGAWGFTRYTFTRSGDEILTTLVEGPAKGGVRCQSEELPCSYADLKELRDSGRPIPGELRLSREDLDELVKQLDSVSAALARIESTSDACAAGYQAAGAQTVNMGIHFVNVELVRDGIFDPEHPEILLYARPGGELLAKDEVGRCDDGKWTGDDRLRLVGAAFQLPTALVGDAHPEGFAGPLDNWHVHYNVCMRERSDTVATEEQCASAGGTWVAKAGWMMHAYVVPGFDSQAGVFAMWNPAIWPTGDFLPDRPTRTASPAVAEHVSEIREARFEPVIEMRSGETLVLRNVDYLPHTVTAKAAGMGAQFDSGRLMTGDEYLLSFDEPGEYEYFCKYHRFMRGRIVVK